MKWKDFDAIIFDLGGVLINLDYDLTPQAFAQIGGTDFQNLYSKASQNSLFDDFETGKISSFHFINRILDLLPKGANPNQVVHAWNKMILNFDSRRLDLLDEIRSEKPIFLLSNTNDLHMTQVRAELKKISDRPLESYFNKVYLSQDIGHRKPHAEAFNIIVEEQQLTRSKTLFIDDSIQHVEGAKTTGLHATHLIGELLEHPYFS